MTQFSIDPPLNYPIFGPEIQCPHCCQTIPALTLTDTYLCPRHGAFEADPNTGKLFHLYSGRHWRLWNHEWYRQHTHADGIRFEINEALDQFYTQGYQATRVIIAQRYRDLISAYLERSTPWRANSDSCQPKLYGLPIKFSPDPKDEPCWEIINFKLEKEKGELVRYPYFRLFE
ncbi:MAG: TIGR02652 family protein [Trichodesmium sp. MAG_R03]|nr:TIGR02652 family protein [Trichodesmium sp. MAG_R03]